jgi:Reverse transcriptase (RNA-dependent DNA polymerase)
VRALWAGLASDYFIAQNGVKQGGELSPILFCIYIDNLLIKLSLLGVGCFTGLNFTGALADADDIVLIAPNPSAMKLLAICDDAYAAEYDTVFNADKSKFLVVSAAKRRLFLKDTCDCNFNVGGSAIVNVCRYSHVGHIITSTFSDINDITYRRNCLVGQANNVFCFFNKLDMLD